MAVKLKKNRKPGRSARIIFIILASLVSVLALLLGISAVNANVVRVRKIELVLSDLPDSFDGVRVLYASDIDLCGINTAEKSAALFKSLQSLKPDLLILGGDYTSQSLLEKLNQAGDMDANATRSLKERTSFFHYIGSFEAPLGKFAIACPDDPERQELSNLMEQTGIQPLFNDRACIRRGNDTVWIVGICDDDNRLNSVGRSFVRSDCVLVAAYGPSILPMLQTSEASDGGQWADVTLCGHTHGGQFLLFGRSALPLDNREKAFLSGWRIDNGQPILVTEGVGCEGANLRLGTEPEVWLITLRKL